ncbi:MAG: EF-hand domain-containing protein [Sphingomicrobium sp.]
MTRFVAGALACFLMLTGAFLIWQSRAERSSSLPPAPAARPARPLMIADGQDLPAMLDAPQASPKNREQRRFSRADKNKDGRIEPIELLAPRQKAFAKLDRNHNGALSFEEWAGKTFDKIKRADKDRNGSLSPAEYATTAPPPPKHKACSCAASRGGNSPDD